MLYIHPDECVDCGACEPVCPVEAIYYEDDVPDQWAATRSTTRTSSPSWVHRAARPRSDRPTTIRRPSRTCRRRARTDDGQIALGPGLGVTAGLPVGHAGRRHRDAPSAHPDGIVDLSVGTPVDPVAPRHPRRTRRRQRRTRLPDHRRHRRSAGVGDGRAAASIRHHRRRRRRRAARHRHQGTHRVAADAARARSGRPRRGARAGVPDLRRRRPARGRAGAARRLAHPTRSADAEAGLPELARATPPARCSASTTSARSSAGRAIVAR